MQEAGAHVPPVRKPHPLLELYNYRVGVIITPRRISTHLLAAADPARNFGMGERFGQRRPPLSVTIKQILERYPDGQIFKVNNNYN